MSYDERKTAQAAALLLQRAGGSLPYIKLLKLLYLSERLSFQRYGVPLSGDYPVSMDHGPVLSLTYDHIKGARRSSRDGWDAYVADQADYMVSLTDDARRVPERDLTQLSDSDVEVLGEVFQQYGAMNKWDLIDFTHTLPEWENPHGSSMPITFQRLFTALGFSQETAARLEAHLRHQQQLDRQFA